MTVHVHTPALHPLAGTAEHYEAVLAAIGKIPALQGLSRSNLEWLARHGEERLIPAGGLLFEEEEPAEDMILILTGEVHVRRQKGGPVSLFTGRTAQVSGVLPYSRMKAYGGDGIASQDVWAMFYPRAIFPQMLEAIPSLGQRFVSVLLDRVREVTRIEQQAEKLTALGQLAGNLAHELNNPASAAQRAAGSILNELESYRQNRFRLLLLCPSEDQVRKIIAWESEVEALVAARLPDTAPLAIAAREDAILRWLETQQCGARWQIAPDLAESGITVEEIAPLAEFLGPDVIQVVLENMARSLRARRFVGTVQDSTERIFDLISAIKTYSQMDRAPILDIDVPSGLDATVQMMHSRMEDVTVIREYGPGLPHISAYGSELNQVWATLIENALDALTRAKEHKRLRLVCKQELDLILVEVWDNGPGIPAELKARIFEPFFTTKAPGSGLGLGLDTANRIVRKHRGHLEAHLEAGATCFRVRLPIDQLQAY